MNPVHRSEKLLFRAAGSKEVPGRPLLRRREGGVYLLQLLGEVIAELPEGVVDVVMAVFKTTKSEV
jgi:hypothetical protein